MTDTHMKLSEAIRKGSAGREQTFAGNWFSETGACCHLGAAGLGAGLAVDEEEFGLSWEFDCDMPLETEPDDLLRQAFPVLTERIKHPIANETLELLGIIVNLNDTYLWTFEQGIAWLEGLGY